MGGGYDGFGQMGVRDKTEKASKRKREKRGAQKWPCGRRGDNDYEFCGLR